MKALLSERGSAQPQSFGEVVPSGWGLEGPSLDLLTEKVPPCSIPPQASCKTVMGWGQGRESGEEGGLGSVEVRGLEENGAGGGSGQGGRVAHQTQGQGSLSVLAPASP